MSLDDAELVAELVDILNVTLLAVNHKMPLCPSKMTVAAVKESHRVCSIIHRLQSSSGVCVLDDIIIATVAFLVQQEIRSTI